MLKSYYFLFALAFCVPMSISAALERVAGPAQDTITLCADSVACNPEIALKGGEEKEITLIVKATGGEKLFAGTFFKSKQTNRVRVLQDKKGKYKLVFDSAVEVKKRWRLFIL